MVIVVQWCESYAQYSDYRVSIPSTQLPLFPLLLITIIVEEECPWYATMTGPMGAALVNI